VMSCDGETLVCRLSLFVILSVWHYIIIVAYTVLTWLGGVVDRASDL